MSKQKTQASHRIKLAQQKALLGRQSKLIASLQAKLAKINNSLGIQKRKNTSLLSDAPDLFDLANENQADRFVKMGEHGWMFRDGKIISAFRMTNDGIVEQLAVTDAHVPSIEIKRIMEL